MTRRAIRILLLATTAALLAAPAGAAGTRTAGDAAPFDLAAFFDGASVSAGEIRTLLVARETFTARFDGTATADGLRLDERFRFAKGERLQRWHLRQAGEAITGTVQTELGDGRLAAPVAVAGERSPGGAVLRYFGPAPGGGAARFRFRHEITANGDGTATNRVTVRRFGLTLARSRVVFARSDAALAAQLASAGDADLIPSGRQGR